MNRNNPLLGRLFARAFLEGESGAGGAPNGGAPAAASATKMFSQEYVTELREEAKMWRQKFQDSDAAHKEASGKLTAAEAAHKTALTDADARANDRVMRAELKAHAIKHGVIDAADALKVLDLSSVKFNDKGELEGVDALFEAAKKAKPYLFGTQNTASTEKTPPPAANTPANVRDMKPAEYEAAKAQMIANSRKR